MNGCSSSVVHQFSSTVGTHADPNGSLDMASERQKAIAEFRQIMKWIAVVALLMVAGALTYLWLTSTLDVNTVVATTLGVFFSVLLGCGLFAAAFFSNKSGIDQDVADTTRSERERR